MKFGLLSLLSIAIAALIGGFTNYLAIRMLFHPRRAYRIGRWRIPFTPGLIPKRKDEIAGALGGVVADYLVTTEGIREWLMKPEFRTDLEKRAITWIEALAASDLTLKDWIHQHATPEQMDSGLLRLAEGLRAGTMRGVGWLWEEREGRSATLRQLIPGWSDPMRDRWSGLIADALLDSAKQELNSANGAQTLRQLAKSWIDQAGGWLGVMAVIFVDEDKLVQKLQPLLISQLESPAIRQMVSVRIAAKLDELGERSLAEMVQWMSGEAGPSAWIEEKLSQLPWERWLNQLADQRISTILHPYRDSLIAAMPRMIEAALRYVSSQMDRIIRSLQLPLLVRDQVQRFPVEQLERIILSVSGKEFRAITWLGALLGGMIGLVQVFLLGLYR